MSEDGTPAVTALAVCATCGRPLERGEWHPAAQVRTEDGARLVSFCSPDCREQFERR